MGLIVKILINSLAVALTAYLLPNVEIDSFLTAIIVAFVLAVINTFIKPIVAILTLPINILTLGMLSFVINGLFILLASNLVNGFTVTGFFWAVIFSIVLSIVSAVLGMFTK